MHQLSLSAPNIAVSTARTFSPGAHPSLLPWHVLCFPGQCPGPRSTTVIEFFPTGGSGVQEWEEASRNTRECAHKSPWSTGAKLHATDKFCESPSSVPHFHEFWDKRNTHNKVHSTKWYLMYSWSAPLGTAIKHKGTLLFRSSWVVKTSLRVVFQLLSPRLC